MVYRVLADGIDIFGSDTESSLLSPSLEMELNSAGSLEFTLPPDHPSYDDISLMQTEIEVYEDEDLIFFGRPAEVGIDWNKQKKVVCEGALAYLNDAAIRPHKFEGALISDVFKYIIAQYNAQVAQNKQFIVGNITITDRYVYTEFDYDICLSVLISTCIDSTGGYLFLRKEDAGIYIDWLAEVPDVSDQPVQFASNMLDLNQDTRAEDICTVVLPVGGQVDGVNITIASVNEGSDILEDSDAIAMYGRILKIQQWNDIIDPQALKDKATEWLAKQQEDDITIETDAAELHYLDGSVGAYRIGQMVNVISGPHGVDKEYPILKMSMSLDSGTKKITLGTPPRKELTELSGITNSTGGGSSSGGGGGGGSSDGVRDVLVNGSSVVSDHVARVSAVTAQQLADGLALKADEDDFEALQTTVAGKASQSDLNALSTTVAGKASQADLNALSTTVAGKQDQLTPGAGINIDANNVISATGGGGTEVEANPSDPATDDLNTIKIGNTVYDIPGGGSSTNYGKFKCDVLFVNDPLPSPTSGTANVTRNYTLNKSIDDYDAVYVVMYGYYTSSQGATNITSRIVFKNDYYLKGFDNYSYYDGIVDPNRMRRINFTFTDSTNIQTMAFRSEDSVEPMLCKVYGLKFENKLINRSDIYSEEERLIGRWTDGKPLYQKTWTGLNVTPSYNVWTNIIDVSNLNIDELCEWESIGGNTVLDGSGIESCISSNGYFMMERNVNVNPRPVEILTLQYTKTTDLPGSGVIPEDPQFVMTSDIYSEEEQVVGRWTDGKPLYQKTITISSVSCDSSWHEVAHNISDIDTIGSVEGVVIDSNGVAFYPANTYRPTYTIGVVIGADKTKIQYINNWLGSASNLIITIKYTKTTDAPGTGPTKGNLIYLPALYSEEEREVGVWTDGKPLYQKTIDVGSLSSGQDIQVNAPSNVDKMVGMFGNAHSSNYNQWVNINFPHQNITSYIVTAAYMASTNKINIHTGTDFTLDEIYITIQYTKTTDQPGSGTFLTDGTPSHHYSTSEKIVGTWIDGSTVYERTWSGICNSDNETLTISSDIKRIVKQDGGIDNSSYDSFISFGYGGNGTDNVQIFRSSSTTIQIQNKYYTSRSNYILTLQYTKTS